MRPLYGPICRVSRSVTYDLTRTATDGGFYFDWGLGDVTGASEFSALFAQWRLDGGAITFTWRSANEANPVRPMFTLAVDPFSTTAPASASELLERSNRTWSPNAQRTTLQLACKPRAIALAASSAGSGALVVSSLAPQSAWYPTSAVGMNYGAVLLWVQGWGATAGTITVKQDYMFSFRSPK